MELGPNIHKQQQAFSKDKTLLYLEDKPKDLGLRLIMSLA